MNTSLQLIEKNVYGKILVYPACEQSTKFAHLLGVKTFNAGQITGIEQLGFTVNVKKLPA